MATVLTFNYVERPCRPTEILKFQNFHEYCVWIVKTKRRLLNENPLSLSFSYLYTLYVKFDTSGSSLGLQIVSHDHFTSDHIGILSDDTSIIFIKAPSYKGLSFF